MRTLFNFFVLLGFPQRMVYGGLGLLFFNHLPKEIRDEWVMMPYDWAISLVNIFNKGISFSFVGLLTWVLPNFSMDSLGTAILTVLTDLLVIRLIRSATTTQQKL